jgi:two-component system KDP operon response regulator KdpE
LVVGDDAAMRQFVSMVLNFASGYGVLEASTAAQTIELTSRHRPDVILLDLRLPDADGSDVTRRIRQRSQVPIIVISAAWDEVAKVKALDEGANDFLVKPFTASDLMARIRAVIRAEPADSQPTIVDLGDEIHIDLTGRSVVARGRPVHLTPTEFKLLAALVDHIGSIVTYGSLLEAVWGPGHGRQVQALRVLMAHLRQKLEQDPEWPKYLSTERGIGYRLRVR